MYTSLKNCENSSMNLRKYVLEKQLMKYLKRECEKEINNDDVVKTSSPLSRYIIKHSKLPKPDIAKLLPYYETDEPYPISIKFLVNENIYTDSDYIKTNFVIDVDYIISNEEFFLTLMCFKHLCVKSQSQLLYTMFIIEHCIHDFMKMKLDKTLFQLTYFKNKFRNVNQELINVRERLYHADEFIKQIHSC